MKGSVEYIVRDEEGTLVHRHRKTVADVDAAVTEIGGDVGEELSEDEQPSSSSRAAPPARKRTRKSRR